MKRNKGPVTRESPAQYSFAITPDDTNPVNPLGDQGYVPRAIQIGAVGGSLTGALIGDNGKNETYFVIAGQILPYQFEFIRATGTDAEGIIGVY